MHLKAHCAPLRHSKTLRIMKITAILLISASLHVSARGFSQTITLKMENAPLQKLFDELSRQSGYNFVYTGQVLQTTEKISVNIRNVSLQKALNICLKNIPLTYSIVERIVVIKLRPRPSQLLPVTDTSHLIKGKVLNENGQPLEGATIKIKGTSAGTSSDRDGSFSIQATDKAILIISYIGYLTREMA